MARKFVSLLEQGLSVVFSQFITSHLLMQKHVEAAGGARQSSRPGHVGAQFHNKRWRLPPHPNRLAQARITTQQCLLDDQPFGATKPHSVTASSSGTFFISMVQHSSASYWATMWMTDWASSFCNAASALPGARKVRPIVLCSLHSGGSCAGARKRMWVRSSPNLAVGAQAGPFASLQSQASPDLLPWPHEHS